MPSCGQNIEPLSCDGNSLRKRTADCLRRNVFDVDVAESPNVFVEIGIITLARIASDAVRLTRRLKGLASDR